MPTNSENAAIGSRFSALLSPIRDIATSWGIDIAKELSDYAESLGIDLNEGIGDNEDNPPIPVDFAEAALLVSGSASIYSRKVEHLYTLVYVAVSTLNQMRPKEKAGAGGLKPLEQNDPDADALLELDEEDFLTLDDDIPQADPKTINLTEESEQLGSLFQDETLLPPVPPMLAFRPTDSSHPHGGASLRMSSAQTHPSGALIMQGCPPVNEDLNTLPSANQREPDLDPDVTQPFDGFAGNDADIDDLDDDHHSIPISADDTQLDNAKDVPPVDFRQKENPALAGSRAIMETAALYGVTSTDRQGKRPKAVKDPFLMLDPHEAIPSLEKPLKVGKTYRRPRKRACNADITVYHAEIPAGANLSDTLLGKIPQSTSLRTYLAVPNIRHCYANVLRKRNAAKRKRPVRSYESGLEYMPECDDSDSGREPEIDPFTDDNTTNFEDNDEGNMIDSPEHLRLPDNSIFDNDDHPELGLLSEGANEHQLTSQMEFLASSFEETCRKYLEKTAWMWEQRTTDTKLLRRVEDWKDRIRPLLDEEETRKDFDITLCGQDLLNRLDATERGTENGRVSITELFSSTARFEVSRMFLSTLQLANNYAIEIFPAMDGAESGRADAVSSFYVGKLVGLDANSGELPISTDVSVEAPRRRGKNKSKRSRQPGSTPKSARRQPLRPRLEPQATSS